MSEPKENEIQNFLDQIIQEDISNGFPVENLRFRFPPEPNGYLHLGHAKALLINFGLAEKYNAPANLRFDDTNPASEEQEFVNSIKEDISWLGFNWDKECYASDYFQQLYDWATKMIEDGKAYMDDQSSEEIVAQRKSPYESGENSPFRNRSVEKNLSLFKEMTQGKGKSVLRAKIDMASPNMNMRDPVMYRIVNQEHFRTKDQWKIYPMYDWAHGQSDYIEGISHSFPSLEFENHRPLYNWYLDQVALDSHDYKPKQREFARGNISYMITSKRKLRTLIEEGVVSGWDDPRMPTLSGLRRRGFTPESIKVFWEKAGVSKRENLIDIGLLEFAVRDHLNKICSRMMVVMDPVKLIIENYEDQKEEFLESENNPEDKNAGVRNIPFAKELWIERDDFMEVAPNKKYFRLSIGNEVRLKSAYIIKAERVEKDANGKIHTLYASYDPNSKSGSGTEESQRKVKGTLHWVSAKHALEVETRVYDRLFSVEEPEADKEKNFLELVNPDSMQISTSFAEPALAHCQVGEKVQFQRLGYFCMDKDSTTSKMVFNRTVSLRDTWAKNKG